MVELTVEHVDVHAVRKSPEGTSRNWDAVKFVAPMVIFSAATASIPPSVYLLLMLSLEYGSPELASKSEEANKTKARIMTICCDLKVCLTTTPGV